MNLDDINYCKVSGEMTQKLQMQTNLIKLQELVKNLNISGVIKSF